MELKPITGTVAVTNQPDFIAPAAPPQTYFGVAENLMPGVRVLAKEPQCAIALCMLCAHVVECLLKAYASKALGSEAAVRKRDIQHNLDALWKLAISEGLRAAPSPPEWVSHLRHLHDSPYFLRYSTEVHGIVLPATEPMVTELAALLELIRTQIR